MGRNLVYHEFRYGPINRAFSDWMTLLYGKGWRDSEDDHKIRCLRRAFVAGMQAALDLVDAGADSDRLRNDCLLTSGVK